MNKALPISVRFLLLAFVPVGLALAAGFFLFGQRIESDVTTGIAQALADSHRAQTRLRVEARQQRQALIAAVAESATLKAGFALWREMRGVVTARHTLEDQLAEIGASLNADLLGATDVNGKPIAAVLRTGDQIKAVEPARIPSGLRMATVGGELFEMIAVPVNTDVENLGSLVVGRRFDPATFHPQTVLLDKGKIAVQAGFSRRDPDLEFGLAACGAIPECPVSAGGVRYLALRIAPELLGESHVGWTLHSVEAASGPLLATARNGLWLALATMLFAALLADLFGARAVVRPLGAMIEKLHEGERSGVLRGDFPENSSTLEVNQLARAYNQAARSVAESQRRLDEAYLEFTRTMAQTLDARDRYTAGHSSRVSDYAVAIAEAMNIATPDIDVIRTGATLHDIGKIGIPDTVLQKPGPLTPEEYEIIQQHPLIGKQILEGVSKFRDYLSIVEMHHENHDGTGYPWGLRGDNIPLGARIVHVVDAFDAMTTSRPYRKAMSPETATAILRKCAGTQFDPAVVEVFLRLVRRDPNALPPTGSASSASLLALDQAVAADSYQEKERAVEPVH